MGDDKGKSPGRQPLRKVLAVSQQPELPNSQTVADLGAAQDDISPNTVALQKQLMVASRLHDLAVPQKPGRSTLDVKIRFSDGEISDSGDEAYILQH